MAALTETTLIYTRSPAIRRNIMADMSPISSSHVSKNIHGVNRTPCKQQASKNLLHLDLKKKSLLGDGILPEISDTANEIHPTDGYTRVRTESESIDVNHFSNSAPDIPKERQKRPAPTPAPTPTMVQCGGALGPNRIPPYLRSAPVRRLRHPLEESPIWSAAGGALSGALSLAVALPALLILSILLPICLLARSMAFFVAVWGRRTATTAENTDGVANSSAGTRSMIGDRPEPVRGNDARWLGPTWRRSVLHAVLVFDSGLEVGALQQLVSNRVLPRHPRLTSRLITLPPPAPPCWLHDPMFKIERHIFPSALKPSRRKLKKQIQENSPKTPGVTEKQLQRYVSRLLVAGLHASKPPWELRVVRGYGKHLDTVAVLRVHQSLADGMSLVRLLCHALADTRVLHVPQQPHFGGQSFSLNAVRACLAGPLTLLLWILLLAAGGVKGRGGGWWSDCNPLTQRTSWSGRITLSWSANIALPKVARVKHVTRSTVNDVLMSALAGALRGLLQGCGVRQPPNLRVVLPVDLRSDISSPKPTSRMGCKVAPVVVALPVAIEGAVPRLWAMRRSLEALKSSSEPVVVYGATAALMALLPQRWACKLLNTPTATASLQFSALPGPPATLLVGGHPLKGVFPILPAPEGLGLSVSAFTYADQIYVTVAADSGLATAAKALLTLLQEQVELLWQLLLHRRLPGEIRPPVIMRNSDLTRPSIQELQSRLYQVQMELQKLSLQVVSSPANQMVHGNGRSPIDIVSRRNLKVDQRIVKKEFNDGGRMLSSNEQVVIENMDDSVVVQVESEENARGIEVDAQNVKEEDALAIARLRILKAEFMELFTELRKRRSMIDGPEMFEDELTGQLWRPRSSSVSRRSLSLAGLLSAAAGRPTPSTSACGSPTSPTTNWDWDTTSQEEIPLAALMHGRHERCIASAPAAVQEEHNDSRGRGRNEIEALNSRGNRTNGISNVCLDEQDMRLEEFRRICPTEKEI